ncbi:hypothetical protein BJF79_13520 [Actinomadura sp. CNU-125]|nr:hypothetical protein BJF79_13520 [Actinomadura sp. CNU-125]
MGVVGGADEDGFAFGSGAEVLGGEAFGFVSFGAGAAHEVFACGPVGPRLPVGGVAAGCPAVVLILFVGRGRGWRVRCRETFAISSSTQS